MISNVSRRFNVFSIIIKDKNSLKNVKAVKRSAGINLTALVTRSCLDLDNSSSNH